MTGRLSVFLVLGTAALVGWSCAPPPEVADAEEPLVTEDVTDAIDAELSTEGDVRGPRWVDSGEVLPAGFPSELPLIGELSVAGSGSTPDGMSYSVLESASSAERIGSAWRSLLVDEGWRVEATGNDSFSASLGKTRVSVSVTSTGGGSRLRVVYP